MVEDAVKLRVADRGDADAITGLVNAAFEVERCFIDGERTSHNKVLTLLEEGEFVLAQVGDLLAGCVYVRARGGRGYLGLLSVDPARRRSGIGSRLVAAAEDRCRAHGCTFIDLQIVNLRLELPAFYRRLGYVENGTAPFPADANPKIPCHFVKMSKPLTPREQPGG
jgi:predicted N-acetyltransferase YhbS